MDAESGAESGALLPKRVVEEGYDQVAQAYAHLEDGEEWPRLRWLHKLLALVPAGASVLDLGCGSGDPADIVIAQAHHVTGVDISQAQIRLARQKVPNGHFIHADAATVEFPAHSFDGVVSFYTLEHIPREEHAAVLAHTYRWLRPRGYFLLGHEANAAAGAVGQWLNVPMLFSAFDAETVQQMMIDAGFETVECATEPQVEEGRSIDYLWLLARRRD